MFSFASYEGISADAILLRRTLFWGLGSRFPFLVVQQVGPGGGWSLVLLDLCLDCISETVLRCPSSWESKEAERLQEPLRGFPLTSFVGTSDLNSKVHCDDWNFPHCSGITAMVLAADLPALLTVTLSPYSTLSICLLLPVAPWTCQEN